MLKLNILRSLSVALALAIGASAGVAHAEVSPTTCDGGIPWVDFDPSNGGRLIIGCTSAGTTYGYFATVNSGSCTDRNVSMDVLKVWKATADEALLSGKVLVIYWNACADGNRIGSISLRR